MKLITRDTDYAVRALCYIATSDKDKVSATELVKELKIPRPFMRKILQILNKEGILRSFKGLGGGFVLAREPKNISLVDLIKAFQESFDVNECTFKKSLCPNTKECELKKRIDNIKTYINEELKNITIGLLIGKAGKGNG
ncbi:RrF2 family transcriptional regulator [Candidatus Auribacterota bacterium]